MNFEVFRSVKDRQKESSDRQTSNENGKVSDEKEIIKAVKSTGGIDEFMELPQVQFFVIVILVLDTFSALGQALLALQISQAERTGGEADLSDMFGFVSPAALLAALNTFRGFHLSSLPLRWD